MGTALQANPWFGRRSWGAVCWECGQQNWLQGKGGSPEEPRAEGAGKNVIFMKKQRGCPWRRLQGETRICTQLLRCYNLRSSWESLSENPREHFLSNKEYYQKKASFPLSVCHTSDTQTFLFVRLICFLSGSWDEVFFEVSVGIMCNPLPSSAAWAAPTFLERPVLAI